MSKLYHLNEKEQATLLSIKSQLTIFQNGVIAEQLKASCSGCSVNYGLTMIQLKEVAGKVQCSASLLDYMWFSDVRELRLLACLLAASDGFVLSRCQAWMAGVTNLELAEQFAMHVLVHSAEQWYWMLHYFVHGSIYQACAVVNSLRRMMVLKKQGLEVFVETLFALDSIGEKQGSVILQLAIERCMDELHFRGFSASLIQFAEEAKIRWSK